ncbi:MAG TPA: DUF5947 family protein [Candidatus Acidoferrales bacterium]|nr:DUF5947 family protein [Candidatus Acidoferrales bacterium]
MSLARFTAANRPPARVPESCCEFCARPIGEDHGHVADVRERRIACACGPCYVLFTASGAAQGRYKSVPRRYVRLDDVRIDPSSWEALALPVDLAFFFFSTPASKPVAFYPSPAGATESLLPLGAWDELVARVPLLAGMEPDVEAFLTDRTGPHRSYVVPIDVCYRLVGLIRSTWKGFDGGDEAHRRLDAFFAELDARCGPARPQAVRA